jgi:erythromycin esterase-like protein
MVVTQPRQRGLAQPGGAIFGSKIMASLTPASLVNSIRQEAQPLLGTAEDYNSLLDLIGDSPIILLGEASHGTHEFYRARADITRRLIQEKGFNAVAVEADWPDAYRVNRYVQGVSDDATSVEALADFKRFPAWMWRNADVLDFVGWLYSYNASSGSVKPKVGFYGLNLYSLYTSIEVVLKYLDKVDLETASRARYRYSCFEHFGEDPQAYGYASSFGLSEICANEVVEQLAEFRQNAQAYMQIDGRIAADEYFYVEQNARLIKNAEEYYRAMFADGAKSWNRRDRHMVETLIALIDHINSQVGQAKIVLWAHNSHLGDASATEMNQRGEINVGQLVRERYGTEAVLVGFTTYAGTVTAASSWGSPAERKHVRPAPSGSYENLFHQAGVPDFMLNFRGASGLATGRGSERLERAIGVIYLPEAERISHYFYASMPHQFDAVLHFDETRAVEPLERTTDWEKGEAPETFPFGR